MPHLSQSALASSTPVSFLSMPCPSLARVISSWDIPCSALSGVSFRLCVDFCNVLARRSGLHQGRARKWGDNGVMAAFLPHGYHFDSAEREEPTFDRWGTHLSVPVRSLLRLCGTSLLSDWEETSLPALYRCWFIVLYLDSIWRFSFPCHTGRAIRHFYGKNCCPSS